MYVAQTSISNIKPKSFLGVWQANNETWPPWALVPTNSSLVGHESHLPCCRWVMRHISAQTDGRVYVWEERSPFSHPGSASSSSSRSSPLHTASWRSAAQLQDVYEYSCQSRECFCLYTYPMRTSNEWKFIQWKMQGMGKYIQSWTLLIMPSWLQINILTKKKPKWHMLKQKQNKTSKETKHFLFYSTTQCAVNTSVEE